MASLAGTATGTVAVDLSSRRRTLLAAGLAHAMHDGYTDLIYVMLPIWQAEFALGYASLAVLRGLYSGVMAALQIPSGRLAERFGGKTMLVIGTAVVALGYGLAGFTGGIFGLCACLALSGAGSSTQHPIASSAVSRAYGAGARGPLGTYNFSGDLGKAAIPAVVSLAVTVMPWRMVVGVLALFGLAMAVVVAVLMPSIRRANRASAERHGGGRGGFALLLGIGVLDSATRMGLLTFLPFVLKTHGASLPDVGVALALVFIGGAAGKFACGWLGGRVGVLWTVMLTEGGTALCIFGLLLLPLLPSMALLPLLGVMLNGTSSVLYGTVPELAPADRAERAFALFYTGTIGAGAVAPVLYGFLGDALGLSSATLATAATALATIPLAFALSPRLVARAD